MRRRAVLIGFGRVAASLGGDARMARWFAKASHLQCLADDPHFELVGIAERSAEARAAARQACSGIRIAADATELAELEPELAVLAIPPEGRHDAILALPSVMGVMLEKPLGAAPVRAPVAALCRERRILAQVNYWRRGDPAMRALVRKRQEFGRVQAAFGLYGNGLRNNGSHLVDLIRMLLGEIAAVRAISPFAPSPDFPLAGDGELAFALELAEGGLVSVQPLDFRHYREVALDVWGTRGRLAIAQEGLSIQSFPLAENRGLENECEIASDNPTKLPVRAGEAMPELYENLYYALEGEQPLMSSLSSAMATERVLDALLESASANGPRIVLLEAA